MINEKIIKIVEKSGGDKDYILVYLLSLYFDLESNMIPENVKVFTNRLKIVDRDYIEGTVKWLIPLFNNNVNIQMTDTWKWVHEEYRKIFINIRKDAGGDKAGTITKMKKYFSEHPEIRKDDVIAAANLYLKPFAEGENNIQFMQRADYFISKQVSGIGGNSIESRLTQYLEILNLDSTEKKEDNRAMGRLL